MDIWGKIMLNTKIRLLLIEDDKVDQMAFERFVRNEKISYHYTVANSFKASENMLKSLKFDVVVTDYSLGDGTAFDIFEMIKNTPNKNTPFIVTTGTGDEEIAVKAMKFGAYDYLIKDPQGNYLKTLPVTVGNAIQRKFAELELQKYQKHLEDMVGEQTRELRKEVSERRQAEEELAKIFTLSLDMICIADISTSTFVKINPAFTETLGYPEKELLERPFLNFIHPEDAAPTQEIVEKKLRQGDKVIDFENRYRCADGNYRWLSWVSHPVPEHGIAYAVGRDITDSKRMEEELKRSREELRNLTAHLQEAIEKEKITISREIHDDFGQTLSALKLDIGWMRKRLHTDQKALAGKMDRMATTINESVQTVKRICSDLRPAILDDFGPEYAIKWLINQFQERTSINCNLLIETDENSFGEGIATALFRIVQEALTNIHRHANATQVKILLKMESDKLILEISDNGLGIKESELLGKKSFGIMGMRERVFSLNGDFLITGDPGKGTRLCASFPLTH
jgi:two-component system, NarL family, sensor histidine kinase UhpB